VYLGTATVPVLTHSHLRGVKNPQGFWRGRRFRSHGGHEVDTQGDSFFVAFGNARDALLAAISIALME
jgi:hypothetical protein